MSAHKRSCRRQAGGGWNLWTPRYPTTEDMLEAYKASPVKYIKARLVPQVFGKPKPSNRLPKNANLWVCSSNWFRWCYAMLRTTALVTATNAHGIIMERASFSDIWALCGLFLVYYFSVFVGLGDAFHGRRLSTCFCLP